ncbi:hypothetical protein SUGI_0244320 [Cryptomeria japonica]|nr:hypothetical protein SUGI_0244320 [Cryptomeria japonica]
MSLYWQTYKFTTKEEHLRVVGAFLARARPNFDPSNLKTRPTAPCFTGTTPSFSSPKNSYISLGPPLFREFEGGRGWLHGAHGFNSPKLLTALCSSFEAKWRRIRRIHPLTVSFLHHLLRPLLLVYLMMGKMEGL